MWRRLTVRGAQASGISIAGLSAYATWNAPPSAPLPPASSTEVLVVGFGLAGASCALEAASNIPKSDTKSGPPVLLLDRFDGGGASCRSGGIVYAGGGTEHQQRCGVTDTPEAMFDYLKAELGDGMGVSEAELRDFVSTSRDNLAFLQKFGVPIGTDGEVCPFKTSYPPDKYTLYYSGSEMAAPFKNIVPPAPRGHRASGKDLTGVVIMNNMKAAISKEPSIKVHPQTLVEELIIDDGKRVSGIRAKTLSKSNRLIRGLHQTFFTVSSTPFPPNPLATKLVHWLETTFGESIEIRATRGVVLSAGGFNFNDKMLEEYAPAYNGCYAIGTLGDNGSGIRLGQQAGAATKLMHRCSAWKFINPPAAFMRGVLVSQDGHRMGNEDVYGARLCERLIEEHGGKGWLIIDQSIWDDARAECKNPERIIPFQKMFALINLYWNHKKASSVSDLATKCNVPSSALHDTIDKYNTNSASGKDPEFQKNPDYCRPLSKPPFYAINYAATGTAFNTPFLTLGGLVVSPQGQVIHKETGNPIPGLFAAGQNACGVPSSSYCSGLALADCVWSGRRSARGTVAAV